MTPKTKNSDQQAGRKQPDQRLRNRRNQILRDKAQEEHDHSVLKEQVKQSSDRSSYMMMRLYIVVGTAIIVTIVAGLHQIRPRFLYPNRYSNDPTSNNDKSAQIRKKAYSFGTLYPSGIILDRDLPRFFRTFAIATPENKDARVAVRKVAESRIHLKDAGVKVVVKAWDDRNVRRYIERNLCGPEFARAYNLAHDNYERQQDLLMWCLLAARVVEGFFIHDIDIVNSPLVFAKGRGIMGKIVDEPRISSSFFVVPRTMSADQAMQLPLNVFDWLLDNDQAHYPSREEYREKLERFIYDELVTTTQSQDQYLTLDVQCTPTKSERAIARYCPSQASNMEIQSLDCCDFVMPLSEGGDFGNDDD